MKTKKYLIIPKLDRYLKLKVSFFYNFCLLKNIWFSFFKKDYSDKNEANLINLPYNKIYTFRISVFDIDLGKWSEFSEISNEINMKIS